MSVSEIALAIVAVGIFLGGIACLIHSISAGKRAEGVMADHMQSRCASEIHTAIGWLGRVLDKKEDTKESRIYLYGVLNGLKWTVGDAKLLGNSHSLHEDTGGAIGALEDEEDRP